MAGLSALDSAYLRSQTNNYSTLFNSMNRSGSSGSFNMFDISGKSNNSLSTNFYSDYASLKNGSYFKLAKTYYAKQASEAKDTSAAGTAEDTGSTDYAKLASTISEAAKQFSGYSASGAAGTVDTAGSIFDTAS